MAVRERVLLVTERPEVDERLETVVVALRRSGGWPFVLALADDDGAAAQFRARLTALGVPSFVLPRSDAAHTFAALGQAVAESESDAVVLLTEPGPLADVAEHAARKAAEDWEIPLWTPTNQPHRGDRVIGEHRFVSVALAPPAPAASGGVSGWMATVGTGLLMIVATTAGTFSYLATAPVGFLLASIAVLGLLLGSRLLHRGRAPSTVAAVLALLTLGVLAVDPFGGGSGSVLIPSTALGWAWVAVVGIGSLVTLVAPDFRALRADRLESREGAAP